MRHDNHLSHVLHFHKPALDVTIYGLVVNIIFRLIDKQGLLCLLMDNVFEKDIGLRSGRKGGDVIVSAVVAQIAYRQTFLIPQIIF